MLAGASVALARKADMIGRERVANLRYGHATYADAKGMFGEPASKRRVGGCVPTLIAKWPGIKMWFDRSEGRTAILGFVRSRAVPTTGGETLEIHTRKGLRVGDTVKRLKRLYPNAQSSRDRGGRRRYQLEGKDGGSFLVAIGDRGRVVVLQSGFTC